MLYTYSCDLHIPSYCFCVIQRARLFFPTVRTQQSALDITGFYVLDSVSSICWQAFPPASGGNILTFSMITSTKITYFLTFCLCSCGLKFFCNWREGRSRWGPSWDWARDLVWVKGGEWSAQPSLILLHFMFSLTIFLGWPHTFTSSRLASSPPYPSLGRQGFAGWEMEQPSWQVQGPLKSVIPWTFFHDINPKKMSERVTWKMGGV